MSLYKYLDDSGLRKTWELIKSYISDELTSLKYGGVNSNFSYNLQGSSGHPSGSSYFCVAKLLLSYTAYDYEELTFSYSFDYGTSRQVEGIYSFNCRYSGALNFICNSKQHTFQNDGAVTNTPTIIALTKQYTDYVEVRIYVAMGNQHVLHIKNLTFGHYTRKLLTSWTSTTKDRWWIRQSGQLSLDDSWCDGTAQSISFTNRYADIYLYVDSASLATVATSGSYNDLSNLPTVDSATSTTSTNAVQNSAITTLVNSKANDNAVVHLASSENITGAKTFIGTGVPVKLKRSSSATTDLSLLVDTDNHPNIRRYDNGSVSQNVLLKSDRIEFREGLNTVNAYVSSNSSLNQDWNTNQLPTKTAVKSLLDFFVSDINVDLESNLVDAEIILTSDFSDLIINFN